MESIKEKMNKQILFTASRKGQDLKVVCGYPKAEPCNYKWNKEAGELTVEFPNPVSARLFCLEEV